MKAIKSVYQQNKLIVISAVLTVICTEVIRVALDIRYSNLEWLYIGDVALRTALLSAGFFLINAEGI